MYPALPLNFYRNDILSFNDSLDRVLSDSFDPFLCPCICSYRDNWESIILHQSLVSDVSILQHKLSRNLLQLFHQNGFECFHYEEHNEEMKLYFIHTSSSCCPVILVYSYTSSSLIIRLLRLPFSSVPPIISTPLWTLLQSQIHAVKEKSGDEIATLSEKEAFEKLLSEEIRLNYAVFSLLSYYYHLSNGKQTQLSAVLLDSFR